MGIALATIGLAAVGFLVLLAFVSVSVHILRCTEASHVRRATENAQERFSWASVGRSIAWAIKCSLARRR